MNNDILRTTGQKEDKNIQILKEIENRNPPGTKLRFSRTIPNFINGTLYIYEIMNDDGVAISENYYYDPSPAHEQGRSFTSMDELALWLNQNREIKLEPQHIYRRRSLSSIFTVQTISAIIAILITTTISFILITNLRHQQFIKEQAFKNNDGTYLELANDNTLIDIPDILSNALTVILGFYFGSEVGKRQETKESDSKEDAG